MKNIRFNHFENCKTITYFYCPICSEKLRSAYIMSPVLCCMKCEKVWDLFYKESKTSIKQVKEDGWLK